MMTDFDEKLAQGQVADQEIEEPLKDEALEDVAGGWGRNDDRNFRKRCKAGLEVDDGCFTCRYYHQTTTHWCAYLEKKMKK